MPTDFIPLPFIVLAAVFLVILFIESILSLRWVPLYMRWGIPIWQQSRPIFVNQFERAASRMDGAEMPNKQFFTVVFRQISPHELAFQNKVGEISVGFRRRMTIRGIIKLDKGQHAVKIVTFFPWFTLVLLISPLVFGLDYYLGFLEDFHWTFLVLIPLFIVVIFGWHIRSVRRINEQILERFIDESRTK